MNFSTLGPVSEVLREARFESLERAVEAANEGGCGLLIVAGDLFHTKSVPLPVVERAGTILGGFDGPCVAVLPGNHDYDEGPDSSLWRAFSRAAAEGTVILRDTVPVALDDFGMAVTIHPAPCGSKHSSENRLSWMDGCSGREDGTVIGVAHGSIEGISPDREGVYFPMTLDELRSKPADIWFIGHTHRRFVSIPEGQAAVIIPGTPEPDGFDCAGSGSVTIVEIDSGTVRAAEAATGKFRYVNQMLAIPSPRELRGYLNGIGSPKDGVLLRLALSGVLDRGELAECREILEAARNDFRYLETDTSDLSERITPETIREEFTEGSFPFRLLERLHEADELGALQTAYRALRGASR